MSILDECFNFSTCQQVAPRKFFLLQLSRNTGSERAQISADLGWGCPGTFAIGRHVKWERCKGHPGGGIWTILKEIVRGERQGGVQATTGQIRQRTQDLRGFHTLERIRFIRVEAATSASCTTRTQATVCVTAFWQHKKKQ